MDNTKLANSTRNTIIDTALCSVIALLNARFSERIHSYYIEGSKDAARSALAKFA